MQILTKGANAPLAADAVEVVLTWRPGPGVPDVDISALLCGPTGKVSNDTDFVFFNQTTHPSGAVRHRGKNRSADVAADTLEVDLATVSAAVDRVVIAASADGPFGRVRDLSVEVHDLASGQRLLQFPMTAAAETAFIAGELYRRGGAWKFRAVAQGYLDGLAGLARDFGISVEDPAPPPAEAPPRTAPGPQRVPPTGTQASPAGVDWLNPPVPAGYEI